MIRSFKDRRAQAIFERRPPGNGFPGDLVRTVRRKLIMLHRAGFRMTEVPVRMFENNAGKSMHSGLKPLYYMFKMLLSICVTLIRTVDAAKK